MSDEILENLAAAWISWESAKKSQAKPIPDWSKFIQSLASAIGCEPSHINVKSAGGGFKKTLNESLLASEAIYTVIVCGEGVASEGDAHDDSTIEHLKEHGSREAVLTFDQISDTSPAQFRASRLTVLQHSPIRNKLTAIWPTMKILSVPNPGSIRASLELVAAAQTSYVSSPGNEVMRQRKKDLEDAARNLGHRLNASPALPIIQWKVNAGQTNNSKAPYVRVFNPIHSPSAQTGFYVCLFVSGDGERVYLSVQQAASLGSKRNYKPIPADQLEANSQELYEGLLHNAEFAPTIQDLSGSRDFDLSDAAGLVGDKAKNFVHANIVAVEYTASDLPSDTALVSAVQQMLRITAHLNEEALEKQTPEQTDTSFESGIAQLIHWSEERIESILDSLLDASPQVVLAGPPGTGKTFCARLIASALLGVPGDIHDSRITVVQFHPTYGYEDFVEGLRPVAKEGVVVFESVPGPIVSLARDIAEDNEPRVLIIDEINRANIPRVFGELMYLLEYRDHSIDLMLQPDFSLPSQLYIIATMNTADKSTRVMDVALRRRFDFFTLDPDVEILRAHYEGDAENKIGEELYSGFEALNKRLEEDLDRHRLVGHSYFMSDVVDIDTLRARWERQIAPLLDEYFFERRAQAGEYQITEFWPSAGA